MKKPVLDIVLKTVPDPLSTVGRIYEARVRQERALGKNLLHGRRFFDLLSASGTAEYNALEVYGEWYQFRCILPDGTPVHRP